jgi:hypothetical protein
MTFATKRVFYAVVVHLRQRGYAIRVTIRLNDLFLHSFIVILLLTDKNHALEAFQASLNLFKINYSWDCAMTSVFMSATKTL